jgi:hypothetical protein
MAKDKWDKAADYLIKHEFDATDLLRIASRLVYRTMRGNEQTKFDDKITIYGEGYKFSWSVKAEKKDV